MTTAPSAHLVVLANENGGGFNVQPGQQQAGGIYKAGQDHSVIIVQEALGKHITSAYSGLTVCPPPSPSRCQGLAQDILSDLVEDACLGLCFEVHRAVKQGYFFLDDTDQESMRDFEIVDQPGLDVFGQVYNQWKNKECVCPNCSRSIAASRFAPHLEKCLGMGRNSSRIANRRIVTGNNTNNKSESDQEDNDDNPNSPRRSKSFKHKNS
ncbi:Ataxin-7-like protein 3, partial [Nibea albiflora]